MILYTIYIDYKTVDTAVMHCRLCKANLQRLHSCIEREMETSEDLAKHERVLEPFQVEDLWKFCKGMAKGIWCTVNAKQTRMNDYE